VLSYRRLQQHSPGTPCSTRAVVVVPEMLTMSACLLVHATQRACHERCLFYPSAAGAEMPFIYAQDLLEYGTPGDINYRQVIDPPHLV
jgi:hypothetical protein